MNRRRRKNMLLFLAGTFVLLALLVTAMPVWFPWIFRPVAQRYGLTYQNYERLTYSRFAAYGIVFSNRNVVVQAARAETFIPTGWLWQYWQGSNATPSFRAQQWVVTVRPPTGRRTRGPSSTYTNAERLDRIFIALHKWVPSAVLTNGRVDVRGRFFQVPHATWRGGAASGSMIVPQRGIEARVDGSVNSNGIAQVRLRSDRLDLDARFSRADTPGSTGIHGTIEWLTNKLEVKAEFGASGRLPRHATLTAPDFSIPAEALRVKGYANVRGRLSAQWIQNGFHVECTARARPEIDGNIPPLTVDISATGDTKAAKIEAAHIASSLINAELSEPVLVTYRAPFIRESVSIKASAELSQQEWFPAKGQVGARALVFPSNSKYPSVNFEVFASALQISNLTVHALAATGEFRWPRLVVPSARMHILESTRMHASAQIDLESNSLAQGSFALSLTNEPGLFPRGMTASNVSVTANVQGPFKGLIHRGEINAGSLATSVTQPVALSAAWEGQHLNLTNVTVTAAAAEKALITMQVAADVAAQTRLIQLQSFSLATNDHLILKLAEPCTITVTPTESSPVTTNGADDAKDKRSFPSVSVSSLTLTGRSYVALAGFVQWPDRGQITNSLRNLEPQVFHPFLRAQAPAGHIGHFNLGAAWSNGPLAFAIDASGAGFITNAGEVRVHARATGNEAGIILQNLSVSSELAPGLTGEGVLPMTLTPGRGINLREDDTLNFRLSTYPDAVVWNALASRFGVALQNPNISALLGGSWTQPHGQINASIGQIRVLNTNRPLPSFDNVQATIDANRERVALTRGRVEVERRPVEITAQVPLGDEFWNSVVKKRTPFDWKKVTAHLVVPQTELQPFAAFLPELMAPQGRFHADLALTNGQIKGVVRARDLRTRPLPSLGPVRDLDIRARFAGSEVKFHPVDATIGGRQVRGEGTLHLPESLTPMNTLPPISFRLWGANVPLVRQPEAIIRADLELELTNSRALKAPEIRGGITMRKSYFLSDLEDLVPGKIAGPKRRPPYFSITNELLADWRLAIDVRGKEFLQIRSPLFRGAASATMRLEGTLREPAALGEIRIDSGRVLFPFATLEVQQGFVTLSSADPYHPNINVVASTRRAGYEIKVEVTGPADNPIVQFSSSPPLSPEQIVLMITAGQMPTDTARLTTEQRAQRMAVFLGGNLLREFGIGSTDEERLSVRSGEQLTETGSQTYEAEYRLTDHLSLVGEYDRFNEFNLGLKWRIYSR